jgi:hypothetical protein
MNPCSYAQVIFDKAPKSYDGEKIAYSTNVVGKLVIYLQKSETRSILATLY